MCKKIVQLTRVPLLWFVGHSVLRQLLRPKSCHLNVFFWKLLRIKNAHGSSVNGMKNQSINRMNRINLDINHHRPAPSNSFQFQRYTCTHAFQTISRATSTNYNNDDTTAIALTLAGGGYVGSILYYCGRPGTTLKKHFAEATIHSSYGMNCLEIPSNTNHFHGVAGQDWGCTKSAKSLAEVAGGCE